MVNVMLQVLACLTLY